MELWNSIPNDWQNILETYSSPAIKEKLAELTFFLAEEKKAGKVIFPEEKNIFQALALCTWTNVHTVIVGQDPYHGVGEAHGLAFSVPNGIRIPPSLRNIFLELNKDLGVPTPKIGSLESWAKNGVLLLNQVLTVEKDLPASHHGRGWEFLTDELIKVLSSHKKYLVFILWGKHAQTKKLFIDANKHLIVESSHPSPFAAHRGFFGSRPFSKASQFLSTNSNQSFDWGLTV